MYGEECVPSEGFLGVRMEDDKVVGIIDYRHPLTLFLLKFGEKKVLLTCDKTNEASRKTIIKNGGVLESEIPDDVGLSESGIIQRYWINL